MTRFTTRPNDPHDAGDVLLWVRNDRLSRLWHIGRNVRCPVCYDGEAFVTLCGLLIPWGHGTLRICHSVEQPACEYCTSSLAHATEGEDEEEEEEEEGVPA